MKKFVAVTTLSLLISCAGKDVKQLDLADETACRNYGYSLHTTGFAYCKEQLKLERHEKKHSLAINTDRYNDYKHQYSADEAAAYDLSLRRERFLKAQEIEKNAVVTNQEARDYLNRPAGTALHEDNTTANRQYIKKADLAGKVEVEEIHNKFAKTVTTGLASDNEVDEKTERNVEKRTKLSEIDGNEPQVDQKDLKARALREKKSQQ